MSEGSAAVDQMLHDPNISHFDGMRAALAASGSPLLRVPTIADGLQALRDGQPGHPIANHETGGKMAPSDFVQIRTPIVIQSVPSSYKLVAGDMVSSDFDQIQMQTPVLSQSLPTWRWGGRWYSQIGWHADNRNLKLADGPISITGKLAFSAAFATVAQELSQVRLKLPVS